MQLKALSRVYAEYSFFFSTVYLFRFKQCSTTLFTMKSAKKILLSCCRCTWLAADCGTSGNFINITFRLELLQLKWNTQAVRVCVCAGVCICLCWYIIYQLVNLAKHSSIHTRVLRHNLLAPTYLLFLPNTSKQGKWGEWTKG